MAGHLRSTLGPPPLCRSLSLAIHFTVLPYFVAALNPVRSWLTLSVMVITHLPNSALFQPLRSHPLRARASRNPPLLYASRLRATPSRFQRSPRTPRGLS